MLISSLRRFISFLLVIGLLGGGTYFGIRYFLNPTERLSQFIDANVNAIFSPLSSSKTSIPDHEIRTLRESFKDSLKKGSGNKQAIASAIRLCDMLIAAIRLREQHIQRLHSVQTASYISMQSKEYQHKDITDKKAFFLNGVMSSWVRESQKLRAKIDAEYSLLRSFER